MNKIFLGCFYSFSGNNGKRHKKTIMQDNPNGSRSLLQLTSDHCQFQNGKPTTKPNHGIMTPPPPLTLQPQPLAPNSQPSDPNLDRLQEDTPKLIHQIILDKTANSQKGMYQQDVNNVQSQHLYMENNSDNSIISQMPINNQTDKSTQTSKNLANNQSNNNNNNKPSPTEPQVTVEKRRLQASASVDNANMKFVFDITKANAFHNPGFTEDNINHSNPFQIPSPELQVMMNTHSNVMVRRKNSLKLSKSDTSCLNQGIKGRHDSQRKLVTRALQSFAASNRANNNNINNNFKQNGCKKNCPDNSLIISNISAINKQKDLLVLDSPCSNEKQIVKNTIQNGLKEIPQIPKEPIVAKEKIKIPATKTEISIPEKLRENGLQSSSDSLDMTAPIPKNSQQTQDGQKSSENNPLDSINSYKVSAINTHIRNLSLDSPLRDDTAQNGMQHICIEKSILDWMHKKYCAEQYRKKRSSSADTVNCINGQYFVQLQEKQPSEPGPNEDEVPSFSLHTLQYYKLPKSTVHAGNYQTAPPSFRREFKYKQQRIITNGTLDKVSQTLLLYLICK